MGLYVRRRIPLGRHLWLNLSGLTVGLLVTR